MNGLTNEEVKIAREKYGTNEITKKKTKKVINIFVDNLGDPIIRILLIALAVKIVFLLKDFDWYETIGIVASILLASIVSTISEYGSEKAFEKLQITRFLDDWAYQANVRQNLKTPDIKEVSLLMKSFENEVISSKIF